MNSCQDGREVTASHTEGLCLKQTDTSDDTRYNKEEMIAIKIDALNEK